MKLLLKQNFLTNLPPIIIFNMNSQNNNNCKFIPSFTNFVTIDCLKDSKFAQKVLENLINNGVFVRMPYSYPQNRCIRVTVGLDKDIDLFEKYFPIALKES